MNASKRKRPSATAAGENNNSVTESTTEAIEASENAANATNELAGKVDKIINVMTEEGVKVITSNNGTTSITAIKAVERIY